MYKMALELLWLEKDTDLDVLESEIEVFWAPQDSHAAHPRKYIKWLRIRWSN